MDHETVSLDDLTPDASNVRVHDARNRQAMAASLKQFGAARSIVVDGNGVVRAGNGTLEAARAAGIDRAIVVDADGDQLVVVRRRDWSNTEATAYSIADNRIGDLSTFNDIELTRTLEAIRDDGLPIEATGFSDEELAKLLTESSPADPSIDDATAPDEFPEHDENIDTEYQCPKCNYTWSGKPK